MPEAQLAWPGDGVAHLWPIELRGVARGAVGQTRCLSHDERLRAAHLSTATGARWRFIAARTALRTILAGYLRTEPDEVAFAYGPLGKPALAGDGAATLSFNLSHAADRALCAVCDGRPVGVDIEMIRPVAGALAIAREMLPPAAVEALRRLPAAARHRAFLQHWTRREACLKAAGLGLGQVASDDRARVPPAFGPQGAWSLRDIQLPPSHLGALAVAGNLAEVTWMDLLAVMKARRREWSTSALQVEARDVGSPPRRAGSEDGQVASRSRT